MSPDDVPALLGLVVGATLLTTPRLWRMLSSTPLVGGKGPCIGTLGALIGCCIVLWSCLISFAAREVRESFGYQLMFVAAGVIAIDIASRGLALLGVDVEADGIERHNAAARIAVVGLWIATTICAIGANIGEGDEIETTLLPLALCVGGLLMVALGMSMATQGFAPVTIERDRAAGLRLGGLFIATSVPLARAASGDWLSTEATMHDFGAALPLIAAVVVIAVVAEVGFTRARRRALHEDSLWMRGFLPAMGYIIIVTVMWRFAP